MDGNGSKPQVPQKTGLRYLDKYPGCIGCPVEKYCGTMISSRLLCNSYKE